MAKSDSVPPHVEAARPPHQKAQPMSTPAPNPLAPELQAIVDAFTEALDGMHFTDKCTILTEVWARGFIEMKATAEDVRAIMAVAVDVMPGRIHAMLVEDAAAVGNKAS